MRNAREVSHEDGIPHYKPNSEFFTLAICRGGLLVGEGSEKNYMNGTVNLFDYCDADKITMGEIREKVLKVGYITLQHLKLWWCIPGKDVSDGLRRLRSEKDLASFVSNVPKHRLLWIYVEELLDFEVADSHDQSDMHAKSSHADEPQDDEVQDAEDWCEEDFLNETFKDSVAASESDESYNLSAEDENSGSDSGSEMYDSDYAVEDDANLVDPGIDIEITDSVLNGQPSQQDRGKSPVCDAEDAESEYEDSDELRNLDGSSDSDGCLKEKKFPTFNPEIDMRNPVFKIGMWFASCQEFREAIKEYSIRNRVKVVFYKNDLSVIRARYRGRSSCPFKIYGRWINFKQAVQVRGLTAERTCVREDTNKWVTYKYLAKRFIDRFKADPKYSMSTFAETVKREIRLNVSRTKLYKARQYAKELLRGDDKEQYSKLWDYAVECIHQMPGSHVYVVPRHNLFDKIFVCLEPCKQGLKEACRPLLCVDGCHIRTGHGGVILTAVGIDPNDCIYPLAYAVVEVEDRHAWIWFLGTVKYALDIDNPKAWTIISDRQKGLISAVEDQFPGVEHRFCVRHLYQNFRAMYKGTELKRMLWACARASYIPEFEKRLLKIKRESVPAFQWLFALDPAQWTSAHQRTTTKCDILLNNISECFNKFILDAGEKPILTMLETIRCQCMKRIYDKSGEAAKFKMNYKFCPKIVKS